MKREPCLTKTLPTFSLQLFRKKIPGVRMSSSLTSGMSLAQQGMAKAIEAGREWERVEIGQTGRPRPGPGHRHLEGTVMRGDTSGP